MSVGHGGAVKVDAVDANRAITDPRVAKLLAQKPIINWEYDLPYVAGYSVDGKTVYVDKHFRPLMPYKGRKINILPFLVLHEHVEASLIHALGYKYQKAHAVAEHVEDRSVEAAGISSDRYEKFYKPYIKADSKEKLVKVPPDLDLTPYRDSHDYLLLQHLQSKM